jgi:hypothetical protein
LSYGKQAFTWLDIPTPFPTQLIPDLCRATQHSQIQLLLFVVPVSTEIRDQSGAVRKSLLIQLPLSPDQRQPNGSKKQELILFNECRATKTHIIIIMG